MLFGSVARGDADPCSDIDVLVLGQPIAAPDHARLSVTVYTSSHLETMARHGSLFVLHLRSEGRVLVDRRHELERILGAWIEPDFERMREGMRAAAAVLDVAPGRFRTGPLLQTALFVLRSMLYLDCARKGPPTFAMRAVARALGDPRIATLFERPAQATGDERPATARLDVTRALLAERFGGMVRNPFGTPEALAVSWHRCYPMASHLAVQLLTEGRGVDYSNAPADWMGP